ncbi:MAG: Gfo/Idh/MocA family oxidoreductase [Pseudomonadota bacterium]
MTALSNSPAYRVAVIGLGYFSQFHVRAWQSIGRTNLVGVCDVDPAKAEQAAHDMGVRGFTDLPDLLRETNPDIVDIVAPPPAHRNTIETAARADRLLICQKPFCQSVAEAEAVADLADELNMPLIVHENFRFQPWHRELKKHLDSGTLGQIFQAHFALRPGDGRGPDAYLSRQPTFQKMQKFLIHETGVHFIDLFGWLFGEITDVYADLRQLNPSIAGEDAGLLLMDHAGGVRTVFDGNRLADHATDNPRRTMGELIVEGEKGSIRLDGRGRLFFRAFGQESEIALPIEDQVDEAAFGGGCVEALCKHAVAALEGKSAFENSARDYLGVMRTVDAAYRSAAAGRKVTVIRA